MTPSCAARIAILALAMSVAAALPGCSTPDAAAASRSRDVDIAQLTYLSSAWDQAIVRKDAAAIAANMADDFRHIGGDGEVETKAPFVADLISPDLRIDPYTVEEFEIRLYGDTALLSGRTRMTGMSEGKPFATHYRYIDIYVRRGDTWKIVSVQTTRLAK